MSAFSVFYRYRFYVLFLSVFLITILSFSNKPTETQYKTTLIPDNSQTTLVTQNPHQFQLTENVHKTVLDNGLTVLIKEVNTVPIVSVQVWYKFGSRHEEPGDNGIAHQLEHMMFKGTQSRPTQFGTLFSALGSDSNAFTSYDQTAYYSTVEREKLKAVLVLEADRMQNAVIDAEKLASEKRVVISELQGYENSPEYRLNRAVMQTVFPHHPYGLPVGGTKADVENFQVEQVQKYYQKYYSPDNAVLIIVGDCQAEKTLAMVKEIFGNIPKRQQLSVISYQLSVISQQSIVNSQQSIVNSQQSIVHSSPSSPPTPSSPSSPSSPPTPSSPSSPSSSPTPLILREPGGAALLQVIYPVPQVTHPDIPALEVVDYILSEGRNSRLYQALVESGLASEVEASVGGLQQAGWYELQVTADPDQDVGKIDLVLDKAIANLARTGVKSEELARAKRQLEAATILSYRTITDQATQLGNDETTAGDYRFTDHYLAAIRQVSSQDVVRVVNKYLQKSQRKVGIFTPTSYQQHQVNSKKPTQHTQENLTSGSSVASSEVMKYLPSLDATDTSQHKSRVSLPQQFTLANGLQVFLLPDKSTPTVTLSGYIKAGTEFDPDGQAGLATLVADSLMSGTKTKNAFTLAQVLDDRGITLDFAAYRNGMSIQGDSLAEDFPVLIQTLADTLQNSTFPQKELELNRQQALTALKMELDDPAEVARRVFVQSIYPQKHPLHEFPTVESLRKLRRQDVIAFNQKYYRPDTTVLVLVGDFAPQQVRSQIAAEFSNWQATGEPPTIQYPQVPLPKTITRVNPVLPGKTQAVTYIGYAGINRQDPRFYAALVLNQILGGDTLSSRLGAQVRDRQGLTYGIYSDFLAERDYGTFWIEMQTSPEDAKAAIASTQQVLTQINQKGVTASELDTAKRTLIGNYNVSLADPEELTHRILMNHIYGLDQSELHSYNQKIEQVTLAEVNQAARELLHPEQMVVVTVGTVDS
ncbi:M16 family metallopeptidase [Anabaena azotica]|uniref:Insulinase family protein n=1 Tax=Anabaena azotica FACHB-119 TaxID=947527 RepID=A0ABR8D6D2_9NOST|nr:pitrilysin family protein [Anabaena azotica]MBD2502709.1 insulinase family protein [Anabaena azotica FACHB-119]